MSRRSSAALPVAIGGVLLVLLVFGLLVVRAQRPLDGPVPIVWDKEACAHCHMHIGEPAFAAQVQLASGTVLNFDDPGCMMAWLKRSKDQPSAVYVRHVKEDRWLTRPQAGFAENLTTPMGFGIGAIDRTQPGAISWEQAEVLVAKKSAERGL